MSGFWKGQRVVTPMGPGAVVYQRMAPPAYSEPEAVSVRVDSERYRHNYVGTMFPAEQVTPAPVDCKGDHPSFDLCSRGRSVAAVLVCTRCGQPMEAR